MHIRKPDPQPPPQQLPQTPQRKSQPSTANQLFHRRIFQIALLVHVISLFACVAASGGLSSTGENHDAPCTQHQLIPKTYQNESSEGKCVVWSAARGAEICVVSGENRLRRLKSTFLFPELQPISLFDVFAAGDVARDSLPRRLRDGEHGADCMRERGARCEACFARLDRALQRLDDAYRSFNQTLFRFDCMPAVDTASATRPFSPNGSCATCRTWYRRWLLVQTVDVWRLRPCINWCYYAQLACPHLATSKVVDYAGHPSFQCRDLDIPSSRESESSYCGCVHPCDLRGFVSGGETAPVPQPNGYDFYAARQHCEARRKQCAPRTTAHDRRTTRTNTAGAAAHAAQATALSIVIELVVVLTVAVIRA